MSASLLPCPGSFRDNAGAVHDDGPHVVRTIASSFSEQWEHAVASGFLTAAVQKGLLIEFEEIPAVLGAWKSLRSPRLPFVSWPYEWSFGQLKAAALHTLDILDEALAHGLVLRDASAYNVQFHGTKPIFIDLLSFEKWEPGKPWKAYLQFCRHFLAPLALMSKRSVLCGKLLANWVEGIPLRLAADMLPWASRFSPTLGIHLHLHAKLQEKYADARESAAKVKQGKLGDNAIPRLSQSLRLAVEGLKLPQSLHTEWGDYYSDTNYTAAGAEDKKAFLQGAVARYADYKGLAVDLGANTAVYSEFLADSFANVIALDIDYLAIERLYQQLLAKEQRTILPLVMDLCNPSPGIGWDNEERPSFMSRCRADYLSALAVIHHLYFTGGIPLSRIASSFAKLLCVGGIHVLEFVPLEDSQVQRLLAAREGDWSGYDLTSCIRAFAPWFELLEQHTVRESCRTLLVLKRKDT